MVNPDVSYSKPSVTLEPSWDIDRLQDPEEFFSAFEKAESKICL